MWPGMALSIEIEEVLFSHKSKYQQIDIFQTKTSGKMLALDGIIQLTEADEFAYHEMLVHTPMFAHPNPQNILVIGGGDGGVLREAARHDAVKKIDFCEIDEEVIKAAKKYLPFTACGFDDPRVKIHIADGNEFLTQHQAVYDVIIVDSTDPIGPGITLFEKPFYKNLKKGLRTNGLIATQGESIFLHKECIMNLVRMTRELFPVQEYANILVPTYPGGHIGICLGSLGPEIKEPSRQIPKKILEQLKYYTPEVHKASFVLPGFAEKMLGSG